MGISHTQYRIDLLTLEIWKWQYAVYYFGVRVAIFHGGGNSGQTFIKCRDLACDAESPPLKKYKDFTITLKIKYLFPDIYSQIFFQISFFFFFFFFTFISCPKFWEWEKYGIRMQKNPKTRTNIFWIFTDFHGVMWVQSPTWSPARKFYQYRR